MDFSRDLSLDKGVSSPWINELGVMHQQDG
jgi:hypothetical protein